MTTTTTGMLDAALEYAERDVPIFPVWWVREDRQCACGNAGCDSNTGKHPIGSAVPQGLLNATTDAAIIQQWWIEYPSANIGAPTGDWCTVLDVDPRHDGDATLAALEAQHGALPDTAEVLTGGGGRHLYFRPVAGLRNSSGRVGAGIDIRGEGGYVLLPPSRHQSGRAYLDEVKHPLFETPLAAMPAWLLARARQEILHNNGTGHAESPDWAARLSGAPAGERHHVACRIAGHYLRLLGVQRAGEVEEILLGFAARCTPPLPEAEARRIARDLVAKERPRTDRANPWALALSAPQFLAASERGLDFLEDKLLAPGSITQWAAPRGLGKTLIAHALLVKHALGGRRALLIDRDNSQGEVKRRINAWGGAHTPLLKILTRENAPALTDRAAWAMFPLGEYDLLVIDSIDAATEGVGEGDSAKPSKALASILDIAHGDAGPAILVLGNTIKSAAHSRGSGIIEDRADICYEVRDATDLRPTGTKDWWHELPPAGVDAWAQRASRRKKREIYKLAFIASKFRIGEEPDPFCFEVDLRTEPWTFRDATADLVAAGKAALGDAQRARAATILTATAKFLAYIETDGVITKKGEDFLVEQGLKRRAARDLIAENEGLLWKREQVPGKGGPKVFRRC